MILNLLQLSSPYLVGMAFSIGHLYGMKILTGSSRPDIQITMEGLGTGGIGSMMNMTPQLSLRVRSLI